MKILLIYPEYEDAFFNPKKVFKLLGKKAAYPPLGLLTVAAMLPGKWEKKLIDLNCENLKDDYIKWADYVFISAIIGQKKSTLKIINTVHKIGKTVVVGGSLFTNGWEEFSNAEVIVLGEAEDVLPVLIDDLKNGTLKKIYSSKKFPDIKKSPIPQWNLANLSNYNSICIQLSRGCPYDCEFCDVVYLNGRIPRIKSKEQLIAELDSLYELGWRAGVFFADDNFIGSKGIIKNEYLPAIAAWQKKKNFPFILSTQVTINLADDSKLMKLMIDARFCNSFCRNRNTGSYGLEECGKYHNKNMDMLESVKKIQNMGFEVNAGFILGFDSDKETVFQNQINFIQKSGIIAAMVGLLNVSPKSKLYERLKKTNRLVEKNSGNNSKLSELNFIPIMNATKLIDGYNEVLATIYSPRFYYARIKTFLREYRPKKLRTPKVRFYHVRGLFSSIWFLGVRENGRHYYWKLIWWSIFKRPGLLPYAIGLPLGLLHFKSLAWAKQYNTYFR